MRRAYDTLAHFVDAVLSHRHITAVVSVGFLLTISVALLSIYQSATRMRTTISDDFNQQQRILARQAASRIGGILGGIATELQGIVTLDDDSRVARTAVLRNAMGRAAKYGVRALRIRDRNGDVVESHWASWADRKERPHLWQSCSRDEHKRLQIGPLAVDASVAGSPAVLSNMCASLSPHRADVVVAEIDVSRLVAGVTDGIRSGRTGYAWVIDETGMFLYHPRRDFIGRNAFDARRERQPYVSYSEINRIMKERMLRGAEGMGSYVSGWHRGITGEISKLISYTPITTSTLAEGTAWSVAVVAPTSEVAQAVHEVYVRHMWAQGAVIAAMFLFGLTAFTYQRRHLKLRVSRQKQIIDTLLENSEEGIIFIDRDNRIQVWGKGAEVIFGYTAEEMIGESFHRLIPSGIDAEEELSRIQREVNQKGYMRNHVATRVTKDGRRLTIDLSRTLVREPDGEIAGSIALIRDITEKTEVDQRIYSTEKLASIGILAAGVAHEINNPLAIILGFTDLLLEKIDDHSPEYEDLKIIEYNANHCKKVVQDMLGFARVTEGLEDTVDVASSIDTVMHISKNTLMTKKIDVERDIPGDLPRVRGDAREFQQVIFNLINNAVSAITSSDSEGGTLALSASVVGEFVHVSVTDTGVGIPVAIQQRIFDPFFTTKKAGEGTGLGLSLCYGIVKKYGGKMSMVSASQQDHPDRPSGTRFTVSMPIATDSFLAAGAET